MDNDSMPREVGSNAGLGPNAPTLTSEQVCHIGFAVLRACNDDRLWRALTYDSGPYDLTTPNLALQELGTAFYAAGYAAGGAQAVDKCNSYIVDNARLAEQVESLRAEVAQARETAEYWKAEHLAGNARIGELHDELAATALRSADHLRKAIKAEAEVALLRAALNGGNVIERLQFALQRLADAADTLGVNHFGDDWLSDEVQELQAATRAARLVLGPNVCYGAEPRPNLPTAE